jgi:hypothetical protein
MTKQEAAAYLNVRLAWVDIILSEGELADLNDDTVKAYKVECDRLRSLALDKLVQEAQAQGFYD